VTFCTLTKVKYKIEHKVHRTKANVSVTIVLTIAFIIIIIKSIILVCCFFLVLVSGRSQVITLKESKVTVAGGNILDETWSRLSKLYT
jgi:hypothetical protein